MKQEARDNLVEESDVPSSLKREEAAHIERCARALRWNIVTMIGPNQKGHFGGSLSIADVVAALFFHKMRHDAQNPAWPDRDRFLLSKGHATLAHYAALAECGYFAKSELARLKVLGGMLQGHPDMSRTPGVEANTGSLGQGLSIACGMAAGLRLDGRASKVYCVVGDGELDEGQIWEAALAAAHYKLDNLVAILDCNGLQATGATEQRLKTSPVAEKWRAFGWYVTEIDGHNVSEILNALDESDLVEGQPKILVARTIKGAGLPFAENDAAFHNGSITASQYELAARLLAGEQTPPGGAAQ
jgi:transketolase